MKNFLFPFIFFILNSFISLAQWNRQPIVNYTSKDYGKEYSNYVYAVTTDCFDNLYAGSVYGILKFDGYRWSFIPVRVGMYITSLAYFQNTIYVGGTNDFGYLKITSNGKLEYISLCDKFHLKLTTPIFTILSINNKIYFQSDSAIYIYNHKTIETIKPQTSYHLAFTVDNQLIVRERKRGLIKISQQNQEFIKNSELFADTGIFAILPYTSNSKLLITQEAGFFEWKDNKFKQILPSNLKRFFQNVMIIGAKKLNDNNIALYTLKNGIIIIDKSFNIIAQYTFSEGLLTNEINDIHQDYYGNIWAATQKGISHIQYSSAFSFYNDKAGLIGNVFCIKRFNHSIYAGTSSGLYVLRDEKHNSFNEVTQVKGKIWDIDTDNNNLLIAGDNGLWQISSNNKIKQLSNNPFSAVVYLAKFNKWLAIGKSGSLIIQNGNKSYLPDLRFNALGKAIVDTNGKYEIWLGSYNEGVYQIYIANNSIYYTKYKGLNDGLPDDWVIPFKIKSQIFFATAFNVLQFVSPEEIKKLSGNTIETDVRGYFDIVSFPTNINNKAITAMTYLNNNTYASIENSIYTIDNKGFADNQKFSTLLDIGRINCLYLDSHYLWIGADDGIVLTNLSKLNILRPLPRFFISSISISGDSTIPNLQQTPVGKKFELPYKNNSIQINLSSLYIENKTKLKYSWAINGTNNPNMSIWDENPTINLTNLRESDYQIHIKAKDASGQILKELEFNFSVLPPWYRTWWAYFIYILLAIGIIYLIVYLNSKRLIAKNRKLEEIIKQRTQEIVKQKEHIEEQKITIERIYKDLNDSITYAQRIQSVLLPTKEFLSHIFKDYFILYKPRNIVSGDFYWAYHNEHITLIAIADCTGHGVPGAFMSMLGISFLDEIVKKKGILEPSKILDNLRIYIIEALKQSINSDSQKDGMDISLLLIDQQKRRFQWAGANNSIYIVTHKDKPIIVEKPQNTSIKQINDNDTEYILNELTPDNMPVAIHPILNPFTHYEFYCPDETLCYLFSDGYADQFGGPKNKKFGYKPFKNLLIQIADKPLEKQGEIIEQTFIEWKNNEEQIDDVTVIGIKV